MAYDLEEQEQLDELKAWWKRYGNLVTGLIIAALVAYAGFQGWHYYQNRQAVEASTRYEALSKLSLKDIAKVRELSGEIMEKYAGTPYAGRAALLAAKANYASKDAASAKAQLEWAAHNAREAAVRAIGQWQLAAIQYEEKQYDAALKTLETTHDAAFDGLYADLRGDILAAQGKQEEARSAYRDALAKLGANGAYRGYTQHKLDALGG